MVFGNMGDDCATGVAFTRDPSTGENSFYGEYLINAQGEDVVAGIRTPLLLTKLARETAGETELSMEEAMPAVFQQLDTVRTQLETHYGDMQDLEFTVQQGTLYMLQTRNGKRTGAAALRMAVEMAEEGLISRDEALLRIDPIALDQLLHPTLDPDAERTVIASGLPASPGAAAGEIVLSADRAEELAAAGKSVILVRLETSPEDIHGMHAAAGILTARGGMTSHAAVVARGMGRACVSGAGELRFDETAGKVYIRDHELAEGDTITIDGGTGEVFLGQVATIQPKMSGAFATVMQWADETRRMAVRTNAETPADARTAVDFGAEGIGLCRTEHMFFDIDRIVAMREMIMAVDTAGREAALAKLLPMQRRISKSCSPSWPASGDDPSSGPAASRVPAAFGRGACRCGRRRRHFAGNRTPAVAETVGKQPDAGASRMPSCGHLSGDLPHAGARHLRGGDGHRRKGDAAPVPEIMIPLAATGRELETLQGGDRCRGRGGRRRDRHPHRISRRHHGRAAPRGRLRG